MSDEVLLRDRVEIERRRDEERRIDRINSVEKALAVLNAVFDLTLKDAVSDDDLKELKRDLEAEVEKTINNLRTYFDKANENQAKGILSEVGGMLAQQRESQAEDQKSLRRQVELMAFGSVLSVVTALIVFWMTRNG